MGRGRTRTRSSNEDLDYLDMVADRRFGKDVVAFLKAVHPAPR